jgi:F-type H+-transporting ATPase subunit epsilon
MSEAPSAKTFQFELVSPERILVSEQAQMAVVPGEAGDFGVLAQHAPLLSSLRPGVVRLTLPSGETRNIFVSGGFADVTPATCSVLAEEAVAVEDLDKAALQSSLAGLEDDLNYAKDDALKLAALKQQIELTKAKIAAA